MRVPSSASTKPSAAPCRRVLMGRIYLMTPLEAEGAEDLIFSMHEHEHEHETIPARSGVERAGEQRRLVLTLCISLVAMVVEALGGFMANSLALMSDAAHMMADAAAIGLPLFALRIASRPPD